MNYKNIRNYLLILVVISLFASYLIIDNYKNRCDRVDSEDVFIEVVSPELGGSRGFLGFNVSTESLHFGSTDPGVTSGKAIKLNYSRSADVRVWSEGKFSDWLKIDPKEFEIEPNVIKDIKLTMGIPLDANPGIKKGKIFVCYKDK
jgi:hypothetical protein